MRLIHPRGTLGIPLIAACLSALPANAQDDPRALSGTWEGTYVCAQGETALRLELRGSRFGVVNGVFRFSSVGGAEARNPEIPSGAYPLLGTASGTSLVLRPVDVRRMPGVYFPVGLLGTVDGRRMEGRIEGAGCTTFAVRKTADAAPGAPLPGGYGEQRWAALAETDAWAMYVDERPAVETGASTARVWVRWTYLNTDAERGQGAGQMVEYDLEYDCVAGLARAWSTVERAPGGELTRFDDLPPFRWERVAKGSADALAFDYACAEEP